MTIETYTRRPAGVMLGYSEDDGHTFLAAADTVKDLITKLVKDDIGHARESIAHFVSHCADTWIPAVLDGRCEEVVEGIIDHVAERYKACEVCEDSRRKCLPDLSIFWIVPEGDQANGNWIRWVSPVNCDKCKYIAEEGGHTYCTIRGGSILMPYNRRCKDYCPKNFDDGKNEYGLLPCKLCGCKDIRKIECGSMDSHSYNYSSYHVVSRCPNCGICVQEPDYDGSSWNKVMSRNE